MGYGEIGDGNDGYVYVGLAVPNHFLGLLFLLYVGDLCVDQIIGERDMWPWILPIHPWGVRFDYVDDVSLHFP